MDFFTTVERRASVRQFEKVDVPLEHLKQIVDAGRRAPSGKNVQPREFVIVTDPAALAALGAAQECIGQASAAIAIVSDGASTYWLEDACASATQMLLAITALGYASVWIEGRLLRMEDEARRILNIPSDKRFAIILPIGRPAAPPAQKDKKPLSDVTHLNRYGQRLA